MKQKRAGDSPLGFGLCAFSAAASMVKKDVAKQQAKKARQENKQVCSLPLS
jgi:hypothetical protein